MHIKETLQIGVNEVAINNDVISSTFLKAFSDSLVLAYRLFTWSGADFQLFHGTDCIEDMQAHPESRVKLGSMRAKKEDVGSDL